MSRRRGLLALLGVVVVAVASVAVWAATAGSDADPTTPVPTGPTATAILAGGCFWCLEADLEKVDGVLSAESGYTAGHLANPTYEQIGRGDTGHTEAVRIVFDPAVIDYAQLLQHFWRNIDPTVANRQFCDRGPQYRSGIYWLDATQRAIAEASLVPVQERFGTVHTEIEEAGEFWPAEEYHQDYARKNPLRYRYYRSSCGRDARLRVLWGEAPSG